MTNFRGTVEFDKKNGEPKTVGGIPDSEFVLNDITEEITARSGKKLFKRIKPYKIDIADLENQNDFFFEAKVDNGVLSFRISTEAEIGKEKIRHPDLYAKELAKRSLFFFDEQGTEVHTLELNWIDQKGMDTNTRQFYEALQNMSDHPTDDDLKKAVFSTWSGKLAQELGFNEIIPTSEGQNVFIHKLNGRVQVRLKRDCGIKKQ